MKFIYSTDLHGDIRKYDTVYETALEHEIDLIHLGADILPKGPAILKRQKTFIKGYLRDFYSRCKEKGITVLASFGNDDIPTRLPYFNQYAQVLDHRPYSKEGYRFIAYSFVPDYPFGLKCACKLDHPGWKFTETYSDEPVEVGSNGLYTIEDVQKYFKNKGTIEEDLQKVSADSNTIAAIHCPPQGLEMDLCENGHRVGSKAILDWIIRERPLLVLSGHIHEAPRFNGGIWKAVTGRTTVIQPGQETDKTTLVIIEIKVKEIKAWRLSV